MPIAPLQQTPESQENITREKSLAPSAFESLPDSEQREQKIDAKTEPKKQPERKKQMHQQPAPITPTAATKQSPIDSEELKNIEDILSEGMFPIYEQMNDEEKMEFKATGEETAKKIQMLLNDTKAKLKNIAKIITKLLHRWLSKIKGRNKFFLEQEAKIKTDRLIEIRKRKDEFEGRYPSL